MNNIQLKIKSFFKKFVNFFNVDSRKHWAFLLYVFFTLATVLILFSLYLLYQIKNDKIFQVKIEQEAKKDILQDDLLKKTTNESNRKNNNILDLENKPFPYKDPSI